MHRARALMPDAPLRQGRRVGAGQEDVGFKEHSTKRVSSREATRAAALAPGTARRQLTDHAGTPCTEGKARRGAGRSPKAGWGSRAAAALTQQLAQWLLVWEGCSSRWVLLLSRAVCSCGFMAS